MEKDLVGSDIISAFLCPVSIYVDRTVGEEPTPYSRHKVLLEAPPKLEASLRDGTRHTTPAAL